MCNDGNKETYINCFKFDGQIQVGTIDQHTALLKFSGIFDINKDDLIFFTKITWTQTNFGHNNSVRKERVSVTFNIELREIAEKLGE